MLLSMIAVALAMALAWWSWRDRLDEALAHWAALARGLGLAALLLLLLDPGIPVHGHRRRPLVLLDHSVSMYATGGRAAEAARLAASLGDTTAFGELAAGEPGGRSDLAEALAGAVATGRPTTVVTDGEIGDADAIPADLLAQATVRVLPRPRGPDVALTGIEAPLRLTAGDTLTMKIEALRTAGTADTTDVVVRDSTAILLHGTIHFGAALRARVKLSAPLPRRMQGEQWLRIERAGAADAEPGDDVRWWRLVVTPTPGVVVVAATPDWDARALYRTLKDVVEVPIRGFVQLRHGQWRRMDDLRSVPAAIVMAAAQHADLLAVRGDPEPWRAVGRARMLWAPADQPGDWYLSAGGVSPVSTAFTGAEADSLPPATGVHPLTADTAGGWIGATARLSRRGTPVPVLIGREDRSGRSVVISADGLYRWPFRGGIADQVWRTMIANSASWLLANVAGDSARGRPAEPVTQRGRRVHFRWVTAGPPVATAIQLHGPHGDHADTLRFDGSGDASLALGVGRYHYALSGGGSGTFAVEPYSEELVPAPITVTEHPGTGGRAAPRAPLREQWWMFAMAILGFGGEWMLRRKLGMR